MSQKSLNVTWHDHLQHLSGLFHDLYENKKLVDVTLYCKEGFLKAHKIVLSSCSPYFSKIFHEIDSQNPVVILKGISYSEMHLLLEFMYKGSINILENELDSLIQAGSYLEIKGMHAKNIPNNMKSCAKRAACNDADETIEITKKIKEELTTIKETLAQQMDKEENVGSKEETSESANCNSIQNQTPKLHTRETRFKGQKRVDVTMLSKKFKFYDDEIPSSPKPPKKNENKGKIHIESRIKAGQKSISPITIKKERNEEKNKDKTQKQIKTKQTDSDEDTLAKIVIKDVYSTEDIKINSSKQKLAENEQEFINITPDVVMNESEDVENNGAKSDEDDDHDEDDEEEEEEEEPESEMLKVSYLECSQCKKTLKTEQEFRDHMKVHGGKPYKCDYCDSYFQRMSHLIRHRRTHTGEKPFSCRECGKCFSRQDKLKQHIRSHDENEYKPPAHLRKKYELPLPSDVKRRGRPKKNIFPVLETPTEKRARGRPRKSSVSNSGEHVENYDITNLPFGDFSYLTSSLPDLNDLTITPVSYLSKSAVEETVQQEKQEIGSESQEIESPAKIKKNLTEPDIEEHVSIVKLDESKSEIVPNQEITIINLNSAVQNEAQTDGKTPMSSDSVAHLSECTILAVTK